MSWTSSIGNLGVLLSIGFIWPQVFRVIVKRSTEGLVPLSFLWGCCASVIWVIYGVEKPDARVVITNAIAIVAISLILIVCVSHKKMRWSMLVGAMSTVLVVGLVVNNISFTMLGVVASAFGVPAIIPQVIRVYRSEHLFGVSATMYALLFLNCTVWLIYAIAIRDWYVLIPNSVGVAGASYIWMRTQSAHQKFDKPEVVCV